jgi:hypothetical protein
MNSEIGDKGTIQVCTENREWGYDPCADGTEIEVVGFAEIPYGRIHNYGKKPGIYHNRSWPSVRLPNGEVINLHSCHVKFDVKRPWSYSKESQTRDFIRDLPETKFWEMDVVGFARHAGNFTIDTIRYDVIDMKCNDGSPYPFYNVRYPSPYGGYTAAEESELTLIERGNVWKLAHNEPLHFSDLTEEANFYHLIGDTEEVRNPRTEIYRWDLDDALWAIREGLADAIAVGPKMFSMGETETMARRFNNREVGERIRQETLKGFR